MKAGFSPVTVSGVLSGETFNFTVTFSNLTANYPSIQYVGALPAAVVFANSVAAPAATQQLTFDTTNVPANVAANGTFELQVGTVTTTAIYFDSTNPTNTATNIQNALVAAGFAGATVSPVSTVNPFSFSVTFTSSKPVIQFVASPTLPATSTFAETTTTQVLNADLLPYFDPFEGDGLGNTFSILYEGGNYNVDTAVDQVLFNAEAAGATDEQLGRLRAILENVGGLLRGESDGVLMSQWDANPIDSQNATYSDDIVSTQRAGQDQRDYVTVPYDVQMGSFQLKITVEPETSPAYQITTGVINMPSTQPAAPGGPIDAGQTATNIAAAIDNVLGQIWPGVIPVSGACNVRVVGDAPAWVVATPAHPLNPEIVARTGTAWQLPANTTAAVNNIAALPGTTPPSQDNHTPAPNQNGTASPISSNCSFKGRPTTQRSILRSSTPMINNG